MEQIARTRSASARARWKTANARDLRRGVKLHLRLLAAAHLAGVAGTAGLPGAPHQPADPGAHRGARKLAAGDLNARVKTRRDDEIGRAIQAFNDMAGRLQESTERLVYLRQLASWQTLARKMAHEVKNSLTPIRLTVEEMLVRYDERDRALHGAGHADRGGRNRDPGAAHPRVLAIRRRTAGAARARRRQRAAAGTHRVPEDGASRGGVRLPAGGRGSAAWWPTRTC